MSVKGEERRAVIADRENVSVAVEEWRRAAKVFRAARTLGPSRPEGARGDRLRVLLVQHCAEYSGSTISGWLVAEGFRKAGWDVDVAFGFEGPAVASYEALGCRTHVVPHKNWSRGGNVLQSGKRMWVEWRNAGAFWRLMREIRPDVVYVNSLVSLAGAVAARRERVPCVWHVRELFDEVGGEMRVPALGGKRLVRWALKRYAARRVAISRAVVENVLGGGLECEIVPNAVGDEFFDTEMDRGEARRALGLPEGGAIVGVPGTLRPVKGHPFFLAAAARMVETNPECRFAITGDGETGYVEQLRERAAELGLAERIDWLGTVKEMPAFYRACDVVCVASRSESFGRTAIEAFACGTPVVASAVGGLRETIEDGRTGLLVEYGDVAGLSDSVVRMLGDPELRARMAVEARREAEGKYTAKAYQERINEIVRAAARVTRRRS